MQGVRRIPSSSRGLVQTPESRGGNATAVAWWEKDGKLYISGSLEDLLAADATHTVMAADFDKLDYVGEKGVPGLVWWDESPSEAVRYLCANDYTLEFVCSRKIPRIAKTDKAGGEVALKWMHDHPGEYLRMGGWSMKAMTALVEDEGALTIPAQHSLGGRPYEKWVVKMVSKSTAKATGLLFHGDGRSMEGIVWFDPSMVGRKVRIREVRDKALRRIFRTWNQVAGAMFYDALTHLPTKGISHNGYCGVHVSNPDVLGGKGCEVPAKLWRALHAVLVEREQAVVWDVCSNTPYQGWGMPWQVQGALVLHAFCQIMSERCPHAPLYIKKEAARIVVRMERRAACRGLSLTKAKGNHSSKMHNGKNTFYLNVEGA